MNKKLIDLIRKNFMARLAVKTGWGRNDIMAEFNAAVSEAVLELLDLEGH